jgi:hypothetical protein
MYLLKRWRPSTYPSPCSSPGVGRSKPACLTGTNDIPIGNRRSVVAGPDPEVGLPATIPVRRLPPGMRGVRARHSIILFRLIFLCITQPLNLDPSNTLRLLDPSSRTELGKNNIFPHDLLQPQTVCDFCHLTTPFVLITFQRHDKARGRKPLPDSLVLMEQYSNGSISPSRELLGSS